jgi:DNA-binding beta-propeller fold protein YncE
MAEALKCPTCAAPLQYPTDGSPTLVCPYCNSTVLLPGSALHQASPAAADISASFGPMINEAMKIAQASQLLRAGKKIEAIKVYRQTFNVDLGAAKKAVEDLGSGRPMNIPRPGNHPGPSSVVAVTRGISIAVAAIVSIVVVIFVSVVAYVIRDRTLHPPKPTPIPTINIPALPSALAPFVTAPTKPAFAEMVMEFGSEGIGAGQFKDARSIAIDGAGHIYVADYSGGRVQVFDATGKFIKLWRVEGDGVIMNLAADRRGIVYVVTPGHLLCYEGITGRRFGEAQIDNNGGQEEYFDAYVGLSGDIYTISEQKSIVILNSDGQIKSKIDAAGKVGDEVDLVKIVCDGAGNMYCLDRSKGVFKFAPDGRYLNRFAMPDENDPSQFATSMNLAVDGQGRVYISGNRGIQVFQSNGRYIDSFGDDEVVFGMAIDDQGEIFGCFRNKNTIRKYVLKKK